MDMRGRGFTLIEMLIVVALFAVLVVMAVPQIQSALSGDRLLSSRDNLAAEIDLARGLAISRNATYEIQIDPQAGTYQVIDVEDPNNPPRGIKQLDPGIAVVNSSGAPIRFFARGYSTGGSIVLVSNMGNACTLTINRAGHVQAGDIVGYETE